MFEQVEKGRNERHLVARVEVGETDGARERSTTLAWCTAWGKSKQQGVKGGKIAFLFVRSTSRSLYGGARP